MTSIVIRVTKVRKEERRDSSFISGRFGMASDDNLSIRCCVQSVLRIRSCIQWVLRIRRCIRLRHVCCLVFLLHSDLQLAFQRQWRPTHRTHRMQVNLFADADSSESGLLTQVIKTSIVDISTTA